MSPAPVVLLLVLLLVVALAVAAVGFAVGILLAPAIGRWAARISDGEDDE